MPLTWRFEGKLWRSSASSVRLVAIGIIPPIFQKCAGSVVNILRVIAMVQGVGDCSMGLFTVVDHCTVSSDHERHGIG